MYEKITELTSKIKRENPLVLNITNYVTMDFIANGLLSIGASPVMSNAQQEITDLMQHAKVVVINLGTLDDKFIALCRHTCVIANQFNKPIILDPVGAGASRYRTDICRSLLNDYDIAFIRGNASEVMALLDVTQKTKGVDSTMQSNDAIASAKTLSKQYNAAIIISGKVDVIVDQDLVEEFDRGSPLMPTITGSGCLLTAVIGAFHAVEVDRFQAAKIGTLFYGICGEIAEQNAKGPGTFRAEFLDALYSFEKLSSRKSAKTIVRDPLIACTKP